MLTTVASLASGLQIVQCMSKTDSFGQKISKWFPVMNQKSLGRLAVNTATTIPI